LTIKLRKILQKRLFYIGNIRLKINTMYLEQKNKKLRVAIPVIVGSDRLERWEVKCEEESRPDEDALDDYGESDSVGMRCCTSPRQQVGTHSRQNPFLWLLEHYSYDSGYALKSFGHNVLFMELVGLSQISLQGDGQGFEILSYLRSKNWVKYYTQILEFKMSDKQTVCTLALDS
jgi:hypothetical protein